jgi:membrane fusion protein, multidrug efflux system
MPPRHLACLAACAALALASCSAPPPPVSGPRPVVVEAPSPLLGPGAGEALPGAIHARVEADLSFRVAGKVAARKVDMGAHVERGTVLAILDPVDARLNLANARSGVAAAEADLSLARAELQRYQDLRTRNFVGQSQLDQRVNLTRLAEARLSQARSQYDLAANQSRYTHLTADAAGVVTQIMVEPGNVVSAGQPVLRFAADGEREVYVSVPEGRVDALRQITTIAIEVLNNPGRHYQGRVRDIDPQADTATRTHLARVTVVDADEQVQLGATATVMLSAETTANSFRLPAAALGSITADKPAVWRIRAGDKGATVEAVPVKVLRYLDGEVLISGPLSSADRLVTAGVHRLTAGMPVQPIERTAKAAL